MKADNVVRILFTATAACLLVLLVVAADTAPPRADTQVFMREKLVYSQGVIEGLALERFDLVSKNAVRLRNMTHSNWWFICRQPDYIEHTEDYQKSTDALYMAAVDKNLDACTDAFVKLARNCVDCHRVVRLVQRQKTLSATGH